MFLKARSQVTVPAVGGLDETMTTPPGIAAGALFANRDRYVQSPAASPPRVRRRLPSEGSDVPSEDTDIVAQELLEGEGVEPMGKSCNLKEMTAVVALPKPNTDKDIFENNVQMYG